MIEHPPGAETQWDLAGLARPAPRVGVGLPGASAGRVAGLLGPVAGLLSASMDQPHLVEGLDPVGRALGGVTGPWRFDRMATVCHPDTGRVSASFAGVAKHYGVQVDIRWPRPGTGRGRASVQSGDALLSKQVPLV